MPCAEIHGATGLDLLEGRWPTPAEGMLRAEVSPIDAMCHALDTAAEAGAPLVLIATGCLTNIARLFRERPESAAKAVAVYIMGGGAHEGNTGPYSEFNIQLDPEAAHEVFHNHVRIPTGYRHPFTPTHFAFPRITCSTRGTYIR